MATRHIEIIPLEAKRIEPRRRMSGRSRRRLWDVVAMVVVGAMLWWAGFLSGHAEARVVVHTVIVYAL